MHHAGRIRDILARNGEPTVRAPEWRFGIILASGEVEETQAMAVAESEDADIFGYHAEPPLAAEGVLRKSLTIRIDADVLAWLRAQRKGYRTRINGLLRQAMESPCRARP